MLSMTLWHAHPGFHAAKRRWKEMDRFVDLDPAVARADLSRRLLAQIRYFGSRADALPEWREAATVRDPDDIWRIWRQLPIITKEHLRTCFSPLEMQSRCRVRGITSSTGGSTGEPTPFVHDPLMRQVTRAVRLYCRHRMGWRPGMPMICVWGSERDIGRARKLKNRIYARLGNNWLVDGYRLDSTTVERVLALVDHHRPVALNGFTSMLEFVAREVLARGDLPPKGSIRTAWNGGEMLFDSQSRVFEQAFGVPILNVYGGRELSAMAFQPRPGASLHVTRPFSFVEIVDDQGRPVAPGELGRLIWTSTVCRGTPFLRYDIGDLGVANAEDQDESGIRRITSLHGRHAGLLTLPDGKTISALFWNHLFKEFPEVLQFQVVLQGSDRIKLRLKGQPFAQEREIQLLGTLRDFIGPMRINVAWTNSIPLTRQGKRLQVVREAE